MWNGTIYRVLYAGKEFWSSKGCFISSIMTYIEEYKEGNKFSGIYLCKTKQVLKTKAGKTYYSLILQDKTGIIDGKVWELNNGIEEFEAMDFIMADGMVTSFQGARQVNINRIRKAQEGEYNPAN